MIYKIQRILSGMRRFGIGRTIKGLLRVLKFRLVNPKSGRIVTGKDNLSFSFLYPIQFSNSLTIFRELVEPEFELLRHVLKKDAVFFDVGAAVGTFSTFAATFTEKPIHCFEPLIENVAVIEQNLNANGLRDKVRVNPVAVSNKAGFGSMSQTERVFYSQLAHDELGTTEVITLDTYCAKNNIEFIDVLKIDVEGHESEVIAGAQRLLRERQIGLLVVERSNNFFSFYEELIQHGFQLFSYEPNVNALQQINLHDMSDIGKACLSPFHSNVVMIQPSMLPQIKEHVSVKMADLRITNPQAIFA